MKTRSTLSLMKSGVKAARKKLFLEAARTGTKLVFLENGKIVKRVPVFPAPHKKLKSATK